MENFHCSVAASFDEWDCCANNVRVDSSHGHDFEISQFA